MASPSPSPCCHRECKHLHLRQALGHTQAPLIPCTSGVTKSFDFSLGKNNVFYGSFARPFTVTWRTDATTARLICGPEGTAQCTPLPPPPAPSPLPPPARRRPRHTSVLGPLLCPSRPDALAARGSNRSAQLVPDSAMCLHSLPASLPTCPPTCLPSSLLTCLPSNVPTCLPASLSTCLHTCLPVHRPVCVVSACLPAAVTRCLQGLYGGVGRGLHAAWSTQRRPALEAQGAAHTPGAAGPQTPRRVFPGGRCYQGRRVQRL